MSEENGKRWWQEVWGKVMAGIILLAVPLLVAGLWKAGFATWGLYGLPPRVKALEIRMDANDAKPPMTDSEIKKLAQELAKEIKK